MEISVLYPFLSVSTRNIVPYLSVRTEFLPKEGVRLFNLCFFESYRNFLLIKAKYRVQISITMTGKKCWYVLVEVVNKDDKIREQHILEADKVKKLDVEEFLNNSQKFKFVKFRAKVLESVDGEQQEKKKSCCVLKVEGRICIFLCMYIGILTFFSTL